MGKNQRYVVGLDIGTTKICCVVGELTGSDTVSIVGIGVVLSALYMRRQERRLALEMQLAKSGD